MKFCVIETYAEFPPLGRIILQHKHKTIAVGVVKSVVKESDEEQKQQ